MLEAQDQALGEALIGAPKPGLRHLGVPSGGPIDRRSHHLACAIVGVTEALEIFMIQTRTWRVAREGVLAFSGAGEVFELDGEPVPFDRPTLVRINQMVKLHPGAYAGCISYAALGPGPLENTQIQRAHATIEELYYQPQTSQSTMNIVALPARSRTGFRFRAPYGVSLKAPEHSRPLARGSIEVTPAGEVIILGPDGPVFGGYGVLGTLTETSCDHLAQIPVGKEVRLVPLGQNSG